MSELSGVKRVVMVVMLMLAGAASGGASGKILMDGVAARVNGDIVTVGDVLAILAPRQQRIVSQYAGAELKSKLAEAYRETLDSVIERRLIIQSYNSREMKLPEWVVDERIDDIIRDSFGGNRAELMAVLARDRMTFEEWRAEWRERIIEGSMRSAFVGQNINISPEAVRERYNRNKEKYFESEKVHLRMIVLDSKDGSRDSAARNKLAGEILARLEGGEDFAVLARKYSDDDKAVVGGDWGWIETRMLRKELALAASSIKPGAPGKIVDAGDATYIISVFERRDQAVSSFDLVQAEIENELRAEEAERLYKVWVKRLREEAYVEINDIDLF